MQTRLISYIGNGIDGHGITGFGIQPGIAIVKSQSTSQYAIMRTAAMGAPYSIVLAAANTAIATGIKSLDADGITLGTSATVNTSGQTYHCMAFADNGAHDFAYNTFLGTGLDGLQINGLGFAPALVGHKPDSSGLRGYLRTLSMVGDVSAEFGSYTDGSNKIQALLSDGFEVGGNCNGNGVWQHWFAFAAVAGCTAYGSYVGDGIDGRLIDTGIDLSGGGLAWVKRDGASPVIARPSSLAGDLALQFANGTASANYIQALNANGFEVGNHITVNASGYTYRWFVWREGDFGAPTAKNASDDAAGSESASVEVATEKSASDDATGSESIAVNAAPHKGAEDGASGAEAITVAKGLPSRFRLDATISPLLVSRFLLAASVYNDHLISPFLLGCTVSPKMTKPFTLGVTIINSDLRDAAAERIIAPRQEVTFS